MTAHLKAIRTGVFILSFIAIGLCLPLLAHAETIVVETAEDLIETDGACSLREAIGATDPDNFNTIIPPHPDCSIKPAPDFDNTIIFTNTLAGATIVVTQQLTLGNSSNSLTIRGNVPIIISAGATTRLFTIAGFTRTVTLDSLGFVNGRALGGNGGAVNITASTSTVNISNSVFVDNQAITTATCDDIFGCTINGGDGGAIFIGTNAGPSTLNLINSEIRNSTARSNLIGEGVCCQNGNGGGIGIQDSIVTVIGSTLVENRAINSGGAIANRNGVLTIMTSVLTGNRAETINNVLGDRQGGAVYNTGTLTIANSTVSNNGALDGGAIANIDGQLNLTGTLVAGNAATDDGGAIHNNEGTATIVNSTLSGNTAGDSGGAVVNFDSSNLTLRHSTIVVNTAEESGGIYNNSTSATLLSASILANNTGGDCYNEANEPIDLVGAGGPQDVTSQGFNLFGNANDFAPTNFNRCQSVATDLITVPANLGVALLADNGGDTFTHALLPGSPAIDAITQDCTITTDQRGAARDALCDIGAYEFPPTGFIGDRIWFDDNGDGLQDSGETGIPNVTVNLFSAGSLRVTTATNGNGIYTFTALAPTTYTVQVVTTTLPVALTLRQTGDPDESIDSATTLLVSNRQPITTADFGYQRLGSISGRVWDDTNGNRQPDGGEPGLANVAVRIEPAISVSVTTTAPDGSYRFPLLPAGRYTITVDPNSGALTTGNYQQTADPDGTFDHRTIITLAAGATVTDANFGYQELSSIGDLVWIDVNANGQQESDEPGIFGVTVILWRDNEADGVPDTQVFSMTTDSNGNYQFTGINPNNAYLLEFVDPQARRFTRPNVQDEAVDSDADPATGRTVPFTLPAGTDADDVDSGYLPSYQITLSPPTASRDVGSTHTVTAQVTALISTFSTPTPQPVTGIDVRFSVRGVNTVDRTVPTDGDGHASFTYQYGAAVNVASGDTITGQVFLHPVLNVAGPIATAMVDWQPLSMSIERSGVWVVEGEVETRIMTATILSAAATPMPGISIGFEVTQNNIRPAITQPTDVNGQVVFSYTSRAPTSQVQASTTDAANQPTVRQSISTLCNSAVSGETDIITIWVDTDGNDQFDGTELFDQCEVASAITLLSLHAHNNTDGSVIIAWQTATEFNNAGFHLHRATAPTGPFVQITQQLIAAQGNSSGANYRYKDIPSGSGPFYYKLEDVDLDDVRTFHGPVQATADLTADDQPLRLFLPLMLR